MYWKWHTSGIALGICFLIAVILVKPIGVSTQFVILGGIIATQFDETLSVEYPTAKNRYSSSNVYLNKSGGKYAKSISEPVNYSFVFVLSMILGGLLGGILGRKATFEPIRQIPGFHKSRFGKAPGLRYLLAFIGGVIVLFGARLAGGCTSGHMMSGMMQTSISGYLFAFAAFAVAVPTAVLIYKKN